MTIRIVVSGTRRQLTEEETENVRWKFFEAVGRWILESPVEVAVGDCPTGVDALIRKLWPAAKVFEAHWAEEGNAAGPRRNRRMLEWAVEGEEPELLAFPDRKSRRGTESAIAFATTRGIPTRIFPLPKL